MSDFEAETLPHYGTIVGYCRNRYPGTGPCDADDLAQEVYRNAWTAWPRFVTPDCGSALPWLLQIAHNVLRSRWRDDARKPVQRLQEWEDHPTHYDDLEAVVAGRMALAAVYAVARMLPAKQRQAVALVVAGREFIRDSPEKSALHRARQELRRRMR